MNAVWPARMQRLTRGRLVDLTPTGTEVWLDGGHNPDGARVIAQALAEREDSAQAPLVVIMGMLGTKDIHGFLKHFSGLVQRLIAVPVTAQMASLSPDDIMRAAHDMTIPSESAPSVEAAILSLHEINWTHPPRVLICGSLYLAGEVLNANGTLPS